MGLAGDASGAGAGWAAESARLAYRALSPGDAASLHEIVAHEAVTRQLGPAWPWPADPGYTASRTGAHQGGGFVWGIFHSGCLVGTVGITGITGVKGGLTGGELAGGELGYMIHPRRQRQGFAHEACTRALGHAFGPMGLGSVQAGVWADNTASLALLARLGFRITGQSLACSAARPVAAPGYDLRLDRETWAALEP